MPSVVDDVELLTLELVGDVDIAEAAGAALRRAVAELARLLAFATGLDVEALVADVEVSLGITDADA
jgi:hypothetical protein